MKTVIGMFATVRTAERAVVALEQQHYPRGDIRLVADRDGDAAPLLDPEGPDEPVWAAARAGAGPGASAGTVLGALLGLLALLDVVTPPGAGSLFAVGPLFAVLVIAAACAGFGALAGGLVGLAMNLGTREVDPRALAGEFRRGGTLVIVRTADDDQGTIAATFNDHGAIDIDERPIDRTRSDADEIARAGAALASRQRAFERGERREEALVTGEVRGSGDGVVGRDARRSGIAVRRVAKPPTGPTRSRTKILTAPGSAPRLAPAGPGAASPRG